MRTGALAVLAASLASAGCASHLLVYKHDDSPAKGIPIRAPVVVTVTTTTTYRVDPNNATHSAYCIPDEKTSTRVLPIGELYFLNFEAAPLGKSEFKVEFADSGVLKGVTLNSDPKLAENVEAANKLLGTILPLATAAAGGPLTIAGVAPSDLTAEQMKAKYCVKEKSEISLERAVIR